MYIVDIIDYWEKAGKAHAELFDNINPVSTMVEVNRLISTEMLVELESDAIVDDV
jgi:enamine deaminase RidA (YjgF/YER057c/UK114 family)